MNVRSEVKASLVLALPIALTQLGQMGMGFIDTVMVGRLGSEALASIALGSAMFYSVGIICLGIILAIEPMVAQAFGADDHEPIGRYTRQGMWLAVFLTVPVVTLFWFAEPVLLALGQDANVVAGTAGYLRAVAPGFVAWLWFVALRGLLEGLHQPRLVTLVMAGGVALNIGANYVLMFGHLGFPAFGIMGTGYATTLVYAYYVLALGAIVMWRRPFREYKVFKHLRGPDWATIGEIVKLGWPIGVSLGLEATLFTVTALMVGWLGTDILAAHQMALQAAALTFTVPLGIGIAASVRVGHAIGQGDRDGARWAGWTAIGLAACFMTGAALTFWFAPEAVVHLFIDIHDPANADVVRMAIAMLGVAAVFQLFDGTQATASGALRGLKDTRVPMLICLIAYWTVGLPIGYVLGFPMELGGVGLWWGLVLGLAVAAVALSLRFRRHVRVAELYAADASA
ncbi:MAG: MATE family efflux transporter [Rhodothermales bacterium]